MKKIIKKIFIAFLTVTIASFSFIGVSGCTVSAPEQKEDVYKVSVSSSEGGTLTADKKEVQIGHAVTFDMQADDGYILYSFKINGGEVDPEQSVSSGKYSYTFTINAATRDYTVKAEFAKKNVVVKFATGENGSKHNDKNVVLGESYGELPTPSASGLRFDGWYDESDERVGEATLVKKSGTITLTARWIELTRADIEGLKPFTATAAYYDAQATKYGVVWHTFTKPVTPIVQCMKSSEADWSKASSFSGDYCVWREEYVTNAVVENLEFATEYKVRFGDLSADVWSDEYVFTTREETVLETDFLFICDTQVTYSQQRIAEELEKYPDSSTWNSNMKQAMKTYIGGATYFGEVVRTAEADGGADFYALGGDIVHYGAEPVYWQEMMGDVSDYLFSRPFMAVAGNHEGGYLQAYYESLSKIFNISSSAYSDYPEDGVYYSFDYGPLHFIALRSNDYLHAADKQLSAAQYEWLENDLIAANANPDTKWIVSMIHEGPFWEGSGNIQPYAPKLLTLFSEYNVALNLYGHNHTLKSSYPFIWNGDETSAANMSNVKAVATLGEQVLRDGDLVDTFVYENDAVRGVINHQTGCGGNQINATTFTKNSGIMRAVSGGGGIKSGVSYSMYSKITVTQNELVLKTYGVDVYGMYEAKTSTSQTVNPLDYRVYIDGFVLTK